MLKNSITMEYSIKEENILYTHIHHHSIYVCTTSIDSMSGSCNRNSSVYKFYKRLEKLKIF